MDYLRCVLCELNEGHDEPLYPHQHHDGVIPLLPCRPCFVGNHEACEPLAPYWCICSHRTCIARML